MGKGTAIDIRRAARAISIVENRSAGADELMRQAYRSARHIPVVGITGPPGAGKLTMIDRLAVHWAESGENVAVLAVDPSSPFTGGAVLGDRYRMEAAATHPRVFVRSLASRGQLGGLSSAAADVVMLFGDLGFDRILLETVGAGQADVDVSAVADVVIVVTVAGLGDHIQAAKAGILEIGDIYAVNKSDRPGALTVAGHLEANLDLIYPGSPGRNAPRNERTGAPVPGNEALRRRHGDPADAVGHWRPPVVTIAARDGSGIDDVTDAVDAFLGWIKDTNRYDQQIAERLGAHVIRTVQARIVARCLDAAKANNVDLDRLAEDVVRGVTTPDEAADRLIDQLRNGLS